MKKVSILVANECFGNCEGCYLDKRTGEELSKDQLIVFAKKLKKLGYGAITLSGGDPLVRPDIAEIVLALKQLGFDINLDTLGTPLLDSNYVANLPLKKLSSAISLIGIPLDGDTEESMMLFRTGLKNIKSDTLSVLKMLDSNNFNISINTVVHKLNLKTLPEIYSIITTFPGVKRWELHQFAPLSKKARGLKEKYVVTDQEFKKATGAIVNDKNIIISPKTNSRKMNFTYLDFNGDFIVVSEGEKTVLFNITEIKEPEISKKYFI